MSVKQDSIKVITVLGTRPEIIRLSRVMSMLDKYACQKIVHTGQNSDYRLNKIFFDDLGIRDPDYYLGVDTSSLGAILGNVLIRIEPILRDEKPDAMLILGDTNSAIAAIIAKRMHIPVYHMEAGNRCFDQNVPEEINRVLVDHISDINMVYSEHARRNLLQEGIHPRKIYITGSPLREVLLHNKRNIEDSQILRELNLNIDEYFLASVHRAETVDNKESLKMLLACLGRVNQIFNKPVVLSVHPRLRARLDALSEKIPDSIRMYDPFGFFDYNKLQMNAYCVLSDSGSISEEAAILSFPAVTIRYSMERPEAMDTGSVMLTGLDPSSVVAAVHCVRSVKNTKIPECYEIPNTSERVLKIILGTARIVHIWNNIRQ